MTTSACIAPPYSLVLVMDSSGGVVPSTLSGSVVASTDSCVAVGCRSDVDGVTEFTLGEALDFDPKGQHIFRGRLKTPSRKVVLRTVIGQTILEAPVAQQETTVQVWVNDPNEPNQVFIGIG